MGKVKTTRNGNIRSFKDRMIQKALNRKTNLDRCTAKNAKKR